MESIRLIAKNELIILGFVDITGNIIYGTDYYDEPRNQHMVETLDGGFHTYGNVVLRRKANFQIKGVIKAQGEAFKHFISSVLRFQAYTLSIDLLGCQIDLGFGSGVNVNVSKLLNTSGENMAERNPPGSYDLKFQIVY